MKYVAAARRARRQSDAQVIAVSDTTTAVYLPTPKPTVNVIDETGTTIVEHAAAQAGVADCHDVARRAT